MKLARLVTALSIGAALAAACSSSDEGQTSRTLLDGGTDASVAGSGGAEGGSGGAEGGSGATAGGGTQSGGAAGSAGATPDASLDGSGGSPEAGSVDAAADVYIPVIGCGLLGDSCASGTDCCSAVCDPTDNTCTSSLDNCRSVSQSCSSPTQCCTSACIAGSCAASCVSDGESCSSDDECCGRSCTSGTCTPLNTSCRIAGNSCSNDAECCSQLCTNGTCNLRSSFCIQEGDICTNGADCCTGRCDVADGASVGVCGPPPSGASYCNDGVEGSVCGACNDCCSRLCAPYGPTGVSVCQPASGCRVTGDFCREDSDCCGAAGTGLPGAGNVTCEIETGSVIGICRNPTSPGGQAACNPQGNVCFFQDYACSVSSARANCCGGLGAGGGVCQLDPLGVPRCNGLDECRQPGETCASADDCCNDVPCIPDDQGVLRCLFPPETGPVCVSSGDTCTIDADCCPGLTCIRAVGSTQGTCGNPNPPPPPPEGGTPEGGTTPPGQCALYGQSCSTSGDCCNAIPCDGGICRLQAG